MQIYEDQVQRAKDNEIVMNTSQGLSCSVSVSAMSVMIQLSLCVCASARLLPLTSRLSDVRQSSDCRSARLEIKLGDLGTNATI